MIRETIIEAAEEKSKLATARRVVSRGYRKDARIREGV
jgi:hypothetical protein